MIEYLKKYGNPDTYENDLKLLKQGIPVQYIIGNVDFYGFNFLVDKNVLIPRFETEGLVFKTIEQIKKMNFENPTIIDVGTGSGCIAITLKKLLAKSNIEAIDISLPALEVAKKNASLNDACILFYQSDLLSNCNNKYDVIISNPPYIAYDEDIMDIVKNNEPKKALYAPDNGLYFYKEILKQSKSKLKNNFLISFEIGANQKDDLLKIAKNFYPDCIIWVDKDLAGFDRYLFIKSS